MDRQFSVRGHAFVPVEAVVLIEAPDADQAIKRANKKLKKRCCDNITIGSEDYGAAWGFDALEATEVVPTEK